MQPFNILVASVLLAACLLKPCLANEATEVPVSDPEPTAQSDHDEHAGHDDSDAHDSHDGEGAAVNVLFVGGDSSLPDESLEGLQGGGHDPKRSGVTLQQVELALHGDVTDDLHGTAFIVQGEEDLELEEAYLEAVTHDSVKWRAGYFLSPFGVINQRHPHGWRWIDQPLIATRMLGGDGSRSLGGRADFALGHDWDTRFSLSLQQADDETLRSFRGRGHAHGEEEHAEGEEEPGHNELVERIEELYGGLTVGNRPFIEDGGLVYTARLSHTWDGGCDTKVQLGTSAMYGPNATGPDASSLLLGADLSLRWQPCEGQWPFVLWESEFMRREFDAAAVFNDGDPAEVVNLPAETLEDSGWYTQILYGFEPQWAAGLRYEAVTGSGDSIGGRNLDPLRDNRTRLSPLLAWYGDGSNTRVRLQYNLDQADHLKDMRVGGDAQSLWLGIDFTLGDDHHRDDPGLEAPGHLEEHAGDGDEHGGHEDKHTEPEAGIHENPDLEDIIVPAESEAEHDALDHQGHVH
jgi:hypothetical protein